MVPEDDQAMVLPWASVMVIMVLLKVAFTCATPEAMFLRSRRRTRVASLPILDPFAARRRSSGTHHSSAARPDFTSSCRQSLWPDLCGCGRWYGCAARGPAVRGGDAIHDSSRDPSGA